MHELVVGLAAKGQVLGVDVVEVNPFFDKTGMTAQTAVRLIIDLLGAALSDREVGAGRDGVFAGLFTSESIMFRTQPGVSVSALAPAGTACRATVRRFCVGVTLFMIAIVARSPHRHRLRAGAPSWTLLKARM